ncbi:alpha/beta fold hydrolase [Herbidospora cretacea]|uniref:alpha/beta fold hydrolase n=1 Tax=Herbidospora cretacea TaxID=28444 RepID=UPI000774E16F|nr:alpha/beta fold hydrolase [Herbidospora cretacea]
MTTKQRVLITRVALAALAATAPAASATPAAPATRPAWTECAGPGNMQCATIDVPVNWAEPGGRTVTLDLARLPATEPARRIGGVLGVPGGPGNDGIEDLKIAAAHLTDLRRRFDLVAYTPRTRVWLDRLPPACLEPGTSLSEPRDRTAYLALAATMTRAFEQCRQADTTGLFAHLDSLSVARDMDAIRRALGEERLSFMANSYGGVAAAAYTRLFPRRVRAMYLDGAINQVDGWRDQTLRTLPLTEQAFTRFAAWCGETTACALHGEDAGEVWRGLVRDADRAPVGGELTGWHLRTFAFLGDPGPGEAHWRAWADAVDRARNGDGSGFADFALGNARVWATPGVLAMTCGDGRGYRSYAEMRTFRRQAEDISPNFGSVAFDGLGCVGWPEPVVNPPRPLPTRGLPPFLGAGSAWGDYAWTESFTRMVPGSVTVRYDGPGHVLYLSGKQCPIRHTTAYLTDLTLPPAGTTCPAG